MSRHEKWGFHVQTGFGKRLDQPKMHGFTYQESSYHAKLQSKIEIGIGNSNK
jgi:hypothetical protein